MVGPWLFWLGPMISVHFPIPFSGMALLFFFWHCDDFP